MKIKDYQLIKVKNLFKQIYLILEIQGIKLKFKNILQKAKIQKKKKNSKKKKMKIMKSKK